MRICLSDNEISSFVGGNLKNDTEIINHLNSCPNCFEQVTTVMSLIDENKDIYDQLNRSYEKMIYKNKLGLSFGLLKKYISDFIDNVLFPRKYYALGTAIVVALIVLNITDLEKTDIKDFSALNLAEEYGSALKNAKVNPFLQKEFAVINSDFDSDPNKKNAFEIGRNLLKMEAVLASGEKNDIKSYLDNITANPLIKQKDGALKEDGVGKIDIADGKWRIESYLKEIDPKLIPYIKYGVLVEASKYKAVKAESSDTELRDSVNELGISVGDMKKYNKILEKINESN